MVTLVSGTVTVAIPPNSSTVHSRATNFPEMSRTQIRVMKSVPAKPLIFMLLA